MSSRLRRSIAAIIWLSLAGLCGVVLTLGGVFLYLDPHTPEAETYRDVKMATPLRVYSSDGALMAEFGERRLVPITIDQVPQAFIDALLDTEDKRFYEHRGIDFISLTNDTFGLLKSLLFEGSIGPGASTITMQLARNVSFSLEVTFIRKFKEMLLALQIENELTKDEILELYINLVHFGKRAYGAEAAAMTYYGKSLGELDLAQLAMLAGIPQAPSAGNPINGPERAIARRNLVLSRMYEQGSIDQAQYNEAVAQPISARVFRRELDVPAPYAAEWVRQQLIYTYPDLYTGGYEVFTTIDGEKQRAAIAALRKGLEEYDERHGYRGPEANLDSAEFASAADDPEAALALAREEIRKFPPRGGKEAAVVVAVDDDAAQLISAAGDDVTLTLDGVEWAALYIDEDTRGPAPKTVSDVLNLWDVVRIEPLDAPADAEEEADKTSEVSSTPEEAGDATAEPRTWRLAQTPAIQGAVVSLDPTTGRVLALSGGYDFSINQFNHALQAARQPGSGFKPFVYSAALANGVTPASVYMDAPLVFDDENLETEYRPDNDNNRYNGPTRLREALYRSINLVSMRVLLDVGASRVTDYVTKFGFDTTSFPQNTQLAIGGGTMAVTPMQMAQAYAVFANGGYEVVPHIIDYMTDADGELVFKVQQPVVCRPCELEALAAQAEAERLALLAAQDGEPMDDAEADAEELMALEVTEITVEPPLDASPDLAGDDASIDDLAEAESEPPVARRVVDERVAYLTHTMLQDVIRRGTGSKARSLERNDLAGKTGTTNDAADTCSTATRPIWRPRSGWVLPTTRHSADASTGRPHRSGSGWTTRARRWRSSRKRKLPSLTAWSP